MKSMKSVCASFVIPLLAAAQEPPGKSPDDQMRGWLGWYVEMSEHVSPDYFTDPTYERPTPAESYRMYVARCEEAGVDRRRALDIIKETVDDYHARGVGGEPNLLLLMGASGDRSLLPWLAGKILAPDFQDSSRYRAAQAYVKIADVDESVAFARKLYAAESNLGGRGWLGFRRAFLDKVSAEAQNMDSGTFDNCCAFLLGIVQDSGSPDSVNMADRFLLKHLPGYADSRQRATSQRFTVTNSAWTADANVFITNMFAPVKAHFDAIPPSKRTDLRIRYPGLPPLPDDPEEAEASASRRVWLITALLAAALALLRRAKKAGTA